MQKEEKQEREQTVAFGIYREMGRALMELRQHNGLSIEEAAERAGLEPSKIEGYERGKHLSSVVRLALLVEDLGGRIEFRPTDNPGLQRFAFTPSSQKTGAVPPPVKKPHPCTGCDHYRRTDSYCDFWKGTIDNSFKCTNQKTTHK